MCASWECTELRQFFAIKIDLAAAIKAAKQDDIDFHLNELATMQMHTTSQRIKRACREAIVTRLPPIAAATAQ